MKNKFVNAIVPGLALALSICAAAPASAATVFVGTCHAPSYTTIQLAASSAPAGSMVNICPGTYAEQVEIKKNLTLQGITVGTANQVVVAAPAGGIVANTVSLESGNPIAAQIWVHDATVSISNVTVDGSGNNGLTGCGVPDLIGIYYQDASGTVDHVVARNQTGVPPNACVSGAGFGIFVQSGISTVTHKAGTSMVMVQNSSVHDFQRNGITGNEVGTKLAVSGNEVRGMGPTTGAAENGIQLGFGATGTVMNNVVIDSIWAPDTFSDPGDSASGILVFDVAGANVSNNQVGNTQFGIGVAGDGSFPANNATIQGNTLDGTLLFDGIDVCGSTGGNISNNTIAGSTESGIHLDGTCAPVPSGGANVMGNTINEGCAGILNGVSQKIGPNMFFNVGNTVLSGDTCSAPAASVSRLQAAGFAHDTVRPNPARP